MKPTGKSYLLPINDYTMRDHSILYSFFYTMKDLSVRTQYSVALNGVNIEILNCPVI